MFWGGGGGVQLETQIRDDLANHLPQKDPSRSLPHRGRGWGRAQDDGQSPRRIYTFRSKESDLTSR